MRREAHEKGLAHLLRHTHGELRLDKEVVLVVGVFNGGLDHQASPTAGGRRVNHASASKRQGSFAWYVRACLPIAGDGRNTVNS